MPRMRFITGGTPDPGSVALGRRMPIDGGQDEPGGEIDVDAPGGITG